MQKENSKIRYFLYARKSSEDEERQVASIEAQIYELEKIAQVEKLSVIKKFSESKSAKEPGRKIFLEMIKKIKDREADGILCWKLDRLARNPEEAGIIIGMLQRGEILHIRTFEKHYRPEDNALLSFVEFGIANQYSRDLSVNVKRGLRNKIKMGWFPGVVTEGYTNSKLSERGSNTILVDESRFKLVHRAFNLILYEGYTPMEALDVLNNKWKYKTIRRKKIGGGPVKRSVWYRMLNSPFYYGWFEWPLKSGNWVKGEHRPMIKREEFERLQVLLGSKGRRISKTREFAYTRLMVCGECNSGITAEQKNQLICSTCKFKFAYENKTACPKCNTAIENMRRPTILNYVFYHCTKKKTPNCAQGSIQVQELEKQIDEYLRTLQVEKKYADWAIKHLKESHKSESGARQSIQETQQAAYNKITKNLDSLRAMRMNDEIDEVEYNKDKSRLMQEKEKYEQLMADISHRQDQAIELSERLFRFVLGSRFWLRDGVIKDRRDVLTTLGSNLIFKDKILHIQAPEPFKIVQRCLTSLQTEKVRLEPTKLLLNKKQNAQVLPARLAWLSGWIAVAHLGNFQRLFGGLRWALGSEVFSRDFGQENRHK